MNIKKIVVNTLVATFLLGSIVVTSDPGGVGYKPSGDPGGVGYKPSSDPGGVGY